MNVTEKYDLMMFNTKIGEFQIDDTVVPRQFRIVMLEKFIGDFRLEILNVRQKDGIVDDKGVREFIKSRVVPRNRVSIDKLLKRIGLSEYDPYLIFKYNRGSCGKDDTWVKFNDEDKFQDFHPRRFYYDKSKENVEPVIFNN